MRQSGLSRSETISSSRNNRSSDIVVRHRVSPNGYLSFILIATFFCGLFLHLEFDLFAILLFLAAWILTPLLLLTDKIVFDGFELSRTGLVPKIWAAINGSGTRLATDEIELVETQALRALKRGGDVYYRYRTVVTGLELRMTLVSGGDSYRQMIRLLLPLVPESALDNRSAELRDYLIDPKDVQVKARFAKIPSAAVLESSIENRTRLPAKVRQEPPPEDSQKDRAERLEFLRQLANELRVAGYLVQALEVFRRALRLSPKDGWLLFEFARCLHSYASAEKNSRLERKALAALRLAENRAKNDERLLTRLGESYFQYGDWRRAKRAFLKTVDLAEDSYRSVRGLAELSLREGKIAHVIHHFGAANRLAGTPALRRWTSSEAAYFERLNSDEEYMDMEVSRVSMLDGLEKYRKTAIRIVVLGLPCIISGMLMDAPLLENAGWAISCVALIVWTGLLVSRNMLSSRLPIEGE